MAMWLLVNLVLSLFHASSVAGWRGIIPLHSTRSDVERLLGPGTNSCKCSYYLEDVSVTFDYSLGDCKSGGSGGWDVTGDTVLRIVVHYKPARLSDLKLDLSKFKKTHGGHIKSLVTYVNDEDGLLIEVNEDGDLVMGYYYYPAARDSHLRCP